MSGELFKDSLPTFMVSFAPHFLHSLGRQVSLSVPQSPEARAIVSTRTTGHQIQLMSHAPFHSVFPFLHSASGHYLQHRASCLRFRHLQAVMYVSLWFCRILPECAVKIADALQLVTDLFALSLFLYNLLGLAFAPF